MSETKFTPGPWGVVAPLNHQKPEIAWRVVDYSERETVIAEVPAEMFDGSTAEEDEANAHLIAAAPLLYQRLDESARQLHAGHGVMFDACTWSQCIENRTALKKARGA